MCINKIKFIDSEKQSLFYKELASFLIPFFAKDFYNNSYDLQNDFVAIQKDDVFPLLMESASLHCEGSTGIYIPAEELASIAATRWKLCVVCNKPFLSYDRFNKTKICYSTTYRRYKQGRDTYFKSVEQNVSQCYMNYRTDVVKRSIAKVN